MKTDRALSRNESGERERLHKTPHLTPLAFITICLIPAVIIARKSLRQKAILCNRLLAAEHAIDELDHQINPEDK